MRLRRSPGRKFRANRRQKSQVMPLRWENSAKPTNSGRIPQVRMISMKNAKDSARVTIDLESGVQYVSGRIANPDRIYFDLHGAKLTPQLAHGKIKADGTLLTAIRVAQSSAGVVRVVLDVNGVKDYTVSLLNSSQKGGPTRLVIDLFANAKAIKAAKVDLTTMGRVRKARARLFLPSRWRTKRSLQQILPRKRQKRMQARPRRRSRSQKTNWPRQR